MRLALLALLPVLASAAVEDFRYKIDVLAQGVNRPMELGLLPDGRIIFNELGGKLRILNPKTQEIIEAGELKVFDDQESGFLGFALDPDFSKNRYIYCLYSPPTYEGGRLSRFTLKDDTLDLASEVKILEFPEQRRECCHHAGTVEFGPDGCLYFSTGDNTYPAGESGDYAPIDERPNMFPRDAQKSASNTNDLRGKINRIRVKPDGTYEIPPGNLFPPGTPNTRPEIYVMGCRNPWRFSIDPKTGFLYYGDVGPDAGGDGPRGSRGYDELNQVRKAGNFGWPYFVGPNAPYADYDFATKKVGAMYDPQHPVNESPNNTGLRDLPPAQPAWIYWSYGKTDKFPELGGGGRTACGGPVFHWRDEFEKTNGFPKEFDRCLFFWDWNRPFMKWARLDADSQLVKIEDFVNFGKARTNTGENVGFKRPVHARFGPDGCLYLMDFGSTWAVNKDSRILRISYERGNLPPIAKMALTPNAGHEPLKVSVSAKGSRDLEGEALSYEWQVGGKVLATGETAELTLTDVGNTRVELHIKDARGGTGIAADYVNVGNTPPKAAFTEPKDGDFYTPGKPIKYAVTVEDLEDGNSSAKPDEFGFRTLVSANWRHYEGKDDVSEQGFTRMKQSDCFNCHAVDKPVVGPSLMAIAERYRGQAGAMDTAIKRVVHGSTGVWGQVAMLPHPQHTADEVAIMLRWVFALDPKKGAPTLTRGLTGEIVVPQDADLAGCVIEATYTDAGRGQAQPLSAKATVTLRPRRVEADRNDGLAGPTRLTGGGCTNKYFLGSINDGHSVRFSKVNLADVRRIKVRTGSGGAGGKMEFHANAKNGPLLGSIDVQNTGGWEKWIEPEVALADNAPRTVTDIYVVFVNPGQSALMNLDWLEFLP